MLVAGWAAEISDGKFAFCTVLQELIEVTRNATCVLFSRCRRRTSFSGVGRPAQSLAGCGGPQYCGAWTALSCRGAEIGIQCCLTCYGWKVRPVYEDEGIRKNEVEVDIARGEIMVALAGRTQYSSCLQPRRL